MVYGDFLREEANISSNKNFLNNFKDAPKFDGTNIKEIINYINNKVLKILLASDYKEKLQNLINKEISKNSNYYDEKVGYFPKIKASYFDDNTILIIDSSQYMREFLCKYITKPIANIFKASVGDGDEGCIYF